MTQKEADKIVLGMGCHPYSRLAMIDALLEGEKIGRAEAEANPSYKLIKSILNCVGYEDESWVSFVRKELKKRKKEE